MLRQRAALRPSGWVLAGLLALGACQPKAPSDAVMVVNHEVLTQSDVAIERTLWPASTERQALDQAIDRRLAAQRAVSLGLHREPWVLERLEAVRAEVLRQALRETVEAEVPTLAPGAVQALYDAHPALYAQRRLYNLRRLDLELPSERRSAVQSKVLAAKHLPELMTALKSERVKVQAHQLVATGPELPEKLRNALATLAEEGRHLVPTAKGLEVWWVVSARAQPISLERARPQIEAQLIERWRKARWQQELANLRATATLQPLQAPAAPAAIPATREPSTPMKGLPPSSQPGAIETY
ncbi:peptidyl-prolyl cis-trans isomerase [Inhella gelatinilytica]|uniref:PpiC domain-containing protein n=1 Tax=Inhella gelatinilytica TaxID=2795030 RepID=A0A931IXM7_9BURK|nr:peptidyl-prolyl cis-trans isomerase [Inhella gelatinilytica]MBH9552523.1 hypothetical protein [Inhella gelatinilytica]